MVRRAALAGLFFLLFPQISIAAPRWVRVSLTGDPATSMTIAWNTDAAADTQVEYGPDTNYGSVETGTSEDFGGDLGVMHTVTLTGLTPDTAYHYRVGGGGERSEDHLFHTAPSDVCAPFSFGIAADNRSDLWGSSGCWPQVYQAIADQGCSFVVNTGDLVKEGQNEGEWADFMDKSEVLTGEIPLMACIGNHDDDDNDGDAALFNQVFAFPRNSSNNMEDFHSFDYGNVHFVALSTHSFTGNHLEVQRAWLEQDLAATDRMWKVVYFHQPIYSSGDHGSNEDGHNPYLIPIFDNHDVDLVITGHDHIYERYKPIRNGQEAASYDEGVCYIVSGGGGAATDPIYAFRSKEDHLEVGDSVPKHHYVQITVTNNIMHVRAERVPTECLTWGTGGTGVIDEFDIVKTVSDDPCAGSTDNDSDGFSPPVDCDDNNPDIYPGAEEICGDGIDQNCDGHDEVCPCEDADADGYESDACGGTDCDDTDPAVNHGVMEVCADSVDNDCDGETDEADCGNCVDEDGDHYYAEGVDCPTGNDCDDTDPDVNPGATEECNGKDDDCNDEIDEGDVCAGDCEDADGDDHYAISANCPSGDDCDDNDAGVYPGAFDSCNNKDDDCDGFTDEDLGTLNCGTGACFTEVPACVDGQQTTCTPLDPPENTEQSCNDGVDNDCDGYVDGDDDDCKGDSGCGCDTGATPSAGLLLLPLLLFFRMRSGNRQPGCAA